MSKEYFWCYLWRQSLKHFHICTSSLPSEICWYQTRNKAWYHHSRRWAFQQIINSWLWDWVFHWWVCLVSIAFLLLTWIQELKVCMSLCPNITNSCTLSPALVRNVACLKSRELRVVLRKVKGIWREQTERQKKDGKRYANTRMTSSLREEKEGWEWGEARAKSRMKHKRKCITKIPVHKKFRNYVTDLEKTI